MPGADAMCAAMRRGSIRIAFALAAFAGGGLGGCDDAAAPSGTVTASAAGALTVVLVTPSADDGALMLTVEGGRVTGVASAASAAGLTVYSAALDSTRTRIIVIGPLAPGPVLTLQVPDVGRAGAYRTTLEQVASGTTYQPRALDGYRVSLAAAAGVRP